MDKTQQSRWHKSLGKHDEPLENKVPHGKVLGKDYVGTQRNDWGTISSVRQIND